MDGDEEERLRSVALQTANSIFLLRQRAEQELIRTKEALELARAEAVEAKRAAQKANDAKTRFLNMISHELRTPLGAIGGYAALLEERIHGALTDEQSKYIARIRHNQAHVLHLVNELLDLAKIESGQFALHLHTVQIAAVIESACTMVETQVRARGLRLEVGAADLNLVCHADRERVEQIVINLLSNAVKFTPAGGLVMIAGACAGDRVCVSVRDTGVGIPAEKLDAVFEAFVQLDVSRLGAVGGTGLGLAISRELARIMGGDLTVESTLGAGSTFTLTLPRPRQSP